MSMATKRTVEETYVMLSQHEHILKRPDTYIGSVNKQTSQEWVFDTQTNKIIKKTVQTTPGFMKIVDEAITNAIDHSNRDPTVKTIKVDISQTTGEIVVTNDGTGIPVEIHSEHNIYIPEMVFGHLLTGSNYDDTIERTGAGRNGLGGKALNIFSKKFKIETVDSVNKKKFSQSYTDNMTVKSKPKVSDNTGKSYTKVSFTPDYQKFDMSSIDDDTYSVLARRVYECIATTNQNVSIYLNGEKLKGKGVGDYAKYFFDTAPIAHEIQGKWEYLVFQSQSCDQVSFVNGNNTVSGGKHVDCVLNQITSSVKTMIETKMKLQNVKVGTIKENIFLFLNCSIPNPKFNSQTKDILTTPIKDFGTTIKVSDAFIKKVFNSPISQEVIDVTTFKDRKKLDKDVSTTKKSKISVKNLDDATNAGTAKSQMCTLYLTEGLSASSFAISGLSVIGRANNGVYPLRGKVLNIREATQAQLLKNEEIIAIKKIIGLHASKKYDNSQDIASLRYGRIAILADADCISGDTPLLLKDDDGNILTETIERLTSDYIPVNGKEYGVSSLKIWTDFGWTDIKCVMRHKVSKVFYRVLTHTGLIDVSEDHPLLTDQGEEKHAIDCSIGDKLLHSFPTFYENKITIPNNLENMNVRDLWEYAKKCKIPKHQSYKKVKLVKILNDIRDFQPIDLKCTGSINKEEAYVMGLFWADGSSGVYNWKYKRRPRNRPREYTFNRVTYSWAISNNNIDFLTKAMNILTSMYSLEFKIIECKTVRKNKTYKLIINGGIKTKSIVEKYTSMFYYKNPHKYKNGNKYIPKEILNASTEIREMFLEGYYNGDGDGHCIKGKGLRFDVEGKISAQCLVILCKSLGYLVSINILENKPNVISLAITKGNQQFDRSTVKKIIRLGRIEKYVYDLETENHHFQAGVGEMIVHNCDGIHISSLIMNVFHFWWPELMKREGFITTLKTPIVKLSKGKQVVNIYSETEQTEFLKNNPGNWVAKYYKGLGTSTAAEAKQTFKDIKTNMEFFITDKNVDKSFELAFDKKKANDRKKWLERVPDTRANRNEKNQITYSDFINKELIQFSNYDNIRSIPHIMDGLKPSQRKVLYIAFKRNLVREMKVAQFGSAVAEETAYHHGEVSLSMTIVNMAQNYTGGNNINLLEPCGNFGFRNHNGKDAASPRYIFTHLTKQAQQLFSKDDQSILEYNTDDGKNIEPKFYVPSLPLILVNGTIGIGTGYSTNIPSFNPDDIIANIKLVLEGKGLNQLVPWYRGFKGTITRQGDTAFEMKGMMNKVNATTITITEIPITTSISDYKEFLETYEEFTTTNMSTENEPNFRLTFKRAEDMKKFDYKSLKLTTKINLTNMHLFDTNGAIKKYNDPNDIIREFVECKLIHNKKRKEHLIQASTKKLILLNNKKQFLEDIMENRIDIYRKSKATIEEILTTNTYPKIDGTYNYLTSLPISSFTAEHMKELTENVTETKRLLEIIKSTTPAKFLLIDLENLKG